MSRKSFSVLIGCAVVISPALAGMPNPHVERWTDRRHMVVGSDLEPQHFATADISAPDGNSMVNVVITCENGTRGSGWSGYFTLLFRHGENVLASAVEHCEVNRGSSEFKQKKYSRPVIVDLSKVICHVDNVQTSITAAPVATKPPPNDVTPCDASAGLSPSMRLATPELRTPSKLIFPTQTARALTIRSD
jgi:hypothetical protein